MYDVDAEGAICLEGKNGHSISTVSHGHYISTSSRSVVVPSVMQRLLGNHQNNLSSRKDQAGYTPLQIGAGLLVVALLVGLAVTEIGTMFTRQKVQSTLTMLAQINQSAADLCPNGDYGSGNGCNIDVGAIAKDGLSKTFTDTNQDQIISPFNSSVTIEPATTDQSNDSLTITVPGVTAGACESLATKHLGGDIISLSVNGTQGAQPAMTANEAEGACAASGKDSTTFTFVYVMKPGN